MASESENNGFLYFIVGGLVVIAAILGLVYMNDGTMGTSDGPDIIQTTERTIERTTDDNNENSLELRADENGVSASSRQSD